MKTQTLTVLASLMIFRAGAQSVLFDFDSLPAHSSLPAAYTVGGITASFTATGQGYSIQPANTLGFTPRVLPATAFIPMASARRSPRELLHAAHQLLHPLRAAGIGL